MKKLTEGEVAEMRGLYQGGWTLHRLAARYRVSASAIRRAIGGQTWAQVAGPPADRPVARTDHRTKLTGAAVVEMRRLYHDGGWTVERLAARYRVARATVHNAVRGQTWAHLADPAA